MPELLIKILSFIGKPLQNAERYAEEELSGNSLNVNLEVKVSENPELDHLKLPSEKETSRVSNMQCGIHKKMSEERRRSNQPWALKIIGNSYLGILLKF